MNRGIYAVSKSFWTLICPEKPQFSWLWLSWYPKLLYTLHYQYTWITVVLYSRYKWLWARGLWSPCLRSHVLEYRKNHLRRHFKASRSVSSQTTLSKCSYLVGRDDWLPFENDSSPAPLDLGGIFCEKILLEALKEAFLWRYCILKNSLMKWDSSIYCFHDELSNSWRWLIIPNPRSKYQKFWWSLFHVARNLSTSIGS